MHVCPSLNPARAARFTWAERKRLAWFGLFQHTICACSLHYSELYALRRRTAHPTALPPFLPFSGERGGNGGKAGDEGAPGKGGNAGQLTVRILDTDPPPLLISAYGGSGGFCKRRGTPGQAGESCGVWPSPVVQPVERLNVQAVESLSASTGSLNNHLSSPLAFLYAGKGAKGGCSGTAILVVGKGQQALENDCLLTIKAAKYICLLCCRYQRGVGSAMHYRFCLLLQIQVLVGNPGA